MGLRPEGGSCRFSCTPSSCSSWRCGEPGGLGTGAGAPGAPRKQRDYCIRRGSCDWGGEFACVRRSGQYVSYESWCVQHIQYPAVMKCPLSSDVALCILSLRGCASGPSWEWPCPVARVFGSGFGGDEGRRGSCWAHTLCGGELAANSGYFAYEQECTFRNICCHQSCNAKPYRLAHPKGYYYYHHTAGSHNIQEDEGTSSGKQLSLWADFPRMRRFVAEIKSRLMKQSGNAAGISHGTSQDCNAAVANIPVHR